jgi:hypothetical protein
MAKKLYITDERMLKLIDWVILQNKADNASDFFKKIGFAKTNISNIRNGSQGFSKEHIRKACVVSGASADYIFGLSNEIRRKAPKTALQQLKDAVIAASEELKK